MSQKAAAIGSMGPGTTVRMGHGATEHGDRIPHAISETEAAKQRTHPASHADSSWVRPGALWATCPTGQSPGVVSSPPSSQLQRSVSFNSSTERKCMRMYWKYWILGGNWSQIHPCLAVKCLYFQHRAQMSAFLFSCVFHQTAPLNPTRCHEHGHLFCEYEADLAQGVRLPRCPRVAAATARRQNQRSRPDVCRPALLSPCHMPGPGLSRGDSVAAARSSRPPGTHGAHRHVCVQRRHAFQSSEGRPDLELGRTSPVSLQARLAQRWELKALRKGRLA